MFRMMKKEVVTEQVSRVVEKPMPIRNFRGKDFDVLDVFVTHKNDLWSPGANVHGADYYFELRARNETAPYEQNSIVLYLNTDALRYIQDTINTELNKRG